ncbi:MAG: nitrate ABC transporter substrate-binding protein [Xanthobacteraceae bacterium]|nr:MAG: nitrate ABC transporter substrate-binding protein [Xanthobacteraceae bacterium]
MTPRRIPRRLAAILAATLACAGLAAAAATPAPTTVRFSLDRRFDAAATPFLLAKARGLFRNEGINLEADAAASSQDAIEKVASGARDIAMADLTALIRYRNKPDAAPVKAVFVLFNRTPYAIVARKSRGITTLGDLESRTLGVPADDPTIRQWPVVARANGVDPAKVVIANIGAAVREPMLSAGQVDAVTTYSFTTPVNLRDRGLPAGDMILFRFADLGCVLYGHAVIVNPRFADEQGNAVKGFLRASLAGLKAALKDPARAIDEILPQMDGAARDLELERWRTIIRDNIVTDEVRRNGLGGIAADRFVAALEQIGATMKFTRQTALDDIFDEAFLPPPAARKL